MTTKPVVFEAWTVVDTRSNRLATDYRNSLPAKLWVSEPPARTSSHIHNKKAEGRPFRAVRVRVTVEVIEP